MHAPATTQTVISIRAKSRRRLAIGSLSTYFKGSSHPKGCCNLTIKCTVLCKQQTFTVERLRHLSKEVYQALYSRLLLTVEKASNINDFAACNKVHIQIRNRVYLLQIVVFSLGQKRCPIQLNTLPPT